MNHKEFFNGTTHGVNYICVEILNKTDKIAAIKELYHKSANEAAELGRNTPEGKRFEAYSEGFRHALNILENLGPAREAYLGIMNPSIKVDFN